MTPHTPTAPPDGAPPSRPARPRHVRRGAATASPALASRLPSRPPAPLTTAQSRACAAARVDQLRSVRAGPAAHLRMLRCLRRCASAQLRSCASAQLRICADRADRRAGDERVVVAVLNRKGGAGKTSLTKDLGYALAEPACACCRSAWIRSPRSRCWPGSGSTRRRSAPSAGC